ncbi:MAG: N-acetyltransferase [Parvularculaceae bacterium]
MRSIMIRSVKQSDRADILRVLAAAFEGEDEARLVEKLWTAEAIALERVAAIGDDIVGYCAFSRVSVAPPVDGVVLGLAPVAVTPQRQNEGVGSELIRDCLAAAKSQAAAVVLLGHKEYYPRFGFTPASAKGVSWDARDAGDAFQLIDFTGIFDGTLRKISYHPAFSAF